ncbi:unnamed protein product, partial [Meganyctiphanes norvegica]
QVCTGHSSYSQVTNHQVQRVHQKLLYFRSSKAKIISRLLVLHPCYLSLKGCWMCKIKYWVNPTLYEKRLLESPRLNKKNRGFKKYIFLGPAGSGNLGARSLHLL